MYRITWEQAGRNRGSSMFLHPGDLESFTAFDTWEFFPKSSRETPNFQELVAMHRWLEWEIEQGSRAIRNIQIERAEVFEPIWKSWEPPVEEAA